jgi:hypothetical protein
MRAQEVPHWRLMVVLRLTFRGEYAGVGEDGLEKGGNRVVVAVENEEMRERGPRTARSPQLVKGT